MRRFAAVLPLALLLLVAAPTSNATGGPVVFDGGTAAQRAQVVNALAASSFDWDVLPEIVVHITRDGDSVSAPGHVWLNARLLDARKFAWGVVQHEFAHQVDFLLFTDADRSRFQRLLGGRTWCDHALGLPHSAYGCERFASTLAWSFWPSRDNCMKPESPRDESAAMAPSAFRLELRRVLGAA